MPLDHSVYDGDDLLSLPAGYVTDQRQHDDDLLLPYLMRADDMVHSLS
jgi:hypothetical protein